MLLLAPILGLVADVILQAALTRIVSRPPHIRLQFVSFAAGGFLALGLLVFLLSGVPATGADKSGYLVLYLLIYACFGFCFFNVISANVSSLRLRMLKELLALDPQPMADAVLRKRYSAQEMVLSRLARLEGGGQIECRSDRYYLRKSGVSLIGRFFAGLRQLLLKS